MKKLLIIAAAALLAAACAKTYEVKETTPPAIGFGTWSDVMTKAPKTAFATDDEFDVFGFKWNTGPANQTNVFNGDDVKYDGTNWTYSPVRYWDTNFDYYTFFAAFPKNKLADEAATNDYAQRGLFISNELTYDGSNEVLLVAQKKEVAKASYGTVPLVFKHTASLVDIKFKKHEDLEDAVVAVTSIKLSGIKTIGKFTVASYDGDNNPVGATVSGVAGLGWTPDGTPTVNAANAAAAAAPYVNTTGASLAAGSGVGTANATALFENLVVMPQILPVDGGAKITITYTITTGTAPNTETTTFTDKEFYFGQFDKTDPDPTDKDNTDPRVSSWMPNTHYTYYITINANAIVFSASIDNTWATDTGHYYLIN